MRLLTSAFALSGFPWFRRLEHGRPQLLFSFSSWGARHQGLGNRRVKAIELPQPTSRHLGAPMASQPASLSTSSRWGCPSAQSLRVQKQQKWLTGRPCKQLSTSVLVGVRGGQLQRTECRHKEKEAAGSWGREPQRMIFYFKYSWDIQVFFTSFSHD